MFQKPTFGSNTSGFGSFNAGAATASPFGGGFKSANTSGFGAQPAFGASATSQPATGGGLFGTATSTGGVFGAQPSSGFGGGGGFGFGASTSSGGLFGASTQAAPLFGAAPAQPFQAKPAGFGFGGAGAGAAGAGAGSTLFGAAPAAGALFGQQPLGGGLFGNTTGGFGQQATGTAHVKYNPVVGTDIVVKSGGSQNVSIKHHCITCMKEYEGKSLEELRLEDYMAGRKSGAAAGGVFGGFSQQTDNKPLFGASTFGQPATTSAPSVFGGGGLGGTTGGFGQTNTFSFGGPQQNTTQTSTLFGASKPAFGATSTAGTGLFGTTTTQAPTFGTATSTFGGFGSTQTQASGGLFGAKPATSGFGATPGAGFGAFGGGGGLFGAKPAAAPAFGAAAPAFGTLGTTTNTSGFGANTSTGSLFGGFGKQQTPAFGFNQPTLGGGLGTNSFQAKPAAPAFGSLGGSLFQQPQQQNTFKTGAEGGLGGGLFGGGLGAPAGLGAAPGSVVPGAVSGNVHEHILSLVARPYGDSPLFKGLVPDTTTAEDALKPTNPAAVQAVLAGDGAYRVSATASRLSVLPRPQPHPQKSLFDGLEEYDASLDDQLSLKPSRKRLVLRPKNTDSTEPDRTQHRSLEEEPRRESAPLEDKSEPASDAAGRADGPRPEDNSEIGSEKQNSWLSSSKLPWNEREKQDGEAASRLYPDLDKEIHSQTEERRSSWLTTKPLRPGPPPETSAEHSVRELGVRSDTHDKENIHTISAILPPLCAGELQFCGHARRRSSRCEIAHQPDQPHQLNGVYVSEEAGSPRPAPAPHPAGVVLTRPGYYTIPSLEDITAYMRPDGSCVVPHLTIGRRNYGNVFYDCEIDVAGLDLDALVHFLNKEVIVYPEDSDKPPVGQGLNRRAVVTLDRVWPRDKSEKTPITDPHRLLAMDYEGKLRRVCDKHDTKFIEYRPQTGSWVFRVEHFSKYGLSDSDEEDDAPSVMKRQLVTQALQGNSAPAQIPPVTSPGLGGVGAPPGPGGLGAVGGLGGLGGVGGLGSVGGIAEDSLYAMQQTSLNLLDGAGKAFDMDTTEDNAESESLYQDSSRGFNVKSPTAELARLENRQSHHVQLMKASIYADNELDVYSEDSTSTGDQQVPRGVLRLPPALAAAAPRLPHEPRAAPPDHTLAVTDAPLRPLVVHPEKIVLKYHRKVLPFKLTIAGRLGASCIADMCVSRARHSRVGFGPRGEMVYPATYALTELPPTAELSELGNYVRGRDEDDWSEMVVARLALGRTNDNATDILSQQMETLLEWSTSEPTSEEMCPRLQLKAAPRDRHRALTALTEIAAKDKDRKAKFGVSGAYCYQVWTLCEALWGADLENDGVAGTDDLSIVNRHRALLSWLKDAVAEVTDAELARPSRAEPEDESDGHSARVWALLLGGRLLEACKVSKDHGDLHMATLIAQAAGDNVVRSLISKQISLWRECGAEGALSGLRLASLQLLAGLAAPRARLMEADWLRTLHAVARYICPKVPSLETVIRTYESFFAPESEDGAAVDLTVVTEDQTELKCPLPPYMAEYDVSTHQNGNQRRVLDLRYELLRARAFNTTPRVHPASHTPDPLDYSLCFLLGVWFGSPSVESITGAAEQLEARGAWHRAVQALAHHPHDSLRGHLIRGVLSRHAPARADTPELRGRMGLLERLRVPRRWVLLAQAHRAKYERSPGVEAEHLAGAEQWNAAHRVLLEELLPEAVLADDLRSITPLLEKLHEAANRHEVSGWQNGGQALYHYIKVYDEIRSLMSSAADRESVQARLEALRPQLAAACRAQAPLAARTARHAAARAEMGARLVQLALAARAPAAPLAALLRALPVPPDYTARAAHQITMELAEQASEACTETPASPPAPPPPALHA